MASPKCPLPEVAEALDPYIRSRDEVAAIRGALRSLLQSQVQTDGASLSPVNVHSPTTAQLGSPPMSISGVHKAYWKTLQAHNAAQAKHDALRADLEKLKHRRSNAGNIENQPSMEIGEDYIPLLRLREKQRKLKAIETAYANIASTGSDLSTTALDDVVKKQVGEMSMPPASHPSVNTNSDAEGRILVLKKALISTKRRVEERGKNVSALETTGMVADLPQMEIVGLQNALQELTSWMESKLAIIASAEADVQPGETPSKTDASDNASKPDVDIEALYQKYLEARERLVQSVNDPPTTLFDHADESLNETSNSKDVNLPGKFSAEILLPYLPALTAGKQEEQSLIQQGAYVRRHITAAETATERLLHRLADESHLVQSGPNSGENWATAAKEAGDATKSYVKARVEAGEASVNSAEEAMESIKSMPASLDRLLPGT